MNLNDYSSPVSEGTNNILNFQEARERSYALSPWKERLGQTLGQLENDSANVEAGLSPDTIAHAKLLFNWLPIDVDAPHIGMNDDGTILFEWYKKLKNKEPTILSFVISEKSFIFSELIEGVPSTRGAMNASIDSFAILLPMLKAHFGIKTYASRLTG